MDLHFIAQPYEDGADLYGFMERIASREPPHRSFQAVVAWAKRSGLRRIEDHLTRMRTSGADMRLVVGIDEGGATKQGLQMALGLFEDVRIFHDPNRGTFHSKVYLAHRDDLADILVGSHNLTAGGVYWNYETGIDVTVSRGEEGFHLLEEVERYVDRLVADRELCLRLTPELLEELANNPRYRIGDEYRRRPTQPREDGPEDVDEAIEEDDESPSLFGRSREAKRRDPRPATRTSPEAMPTRRTAAARGGTDVAQPVVEGPTPATAERLTVVRRWYKRLPSSDAQHVQEGTAPTGNLRLAQAGHPIDHKVWFRDDFFGNVHWETKPTPSGDLEVALVPFEVVINGSAPEAHVLRVDHAAYRIADQNNVPTVLKWGDLNPLFRGRNFTNWWVILERRADGTFSIELTDTEPPAGSFLG